MVGHFSYGSVEKLWKCSVSVASILRVSFQKQKAYSFFMILCNPNFTHCSSLKMLMNSFSVLKVTSSLGSPV